MSLVVIVIYPNIIGQTKINLEFRLKKHMQNMINQELPKSSITKHSWHCNSFNFQNEKIIFNAYYISELYFPDNLDFFLNHQAIVNQKFDSKKSSSAWKNLFSSKNFLYPSALLFSKMFVGLCIFFFFLLFSCLILFSFSTVCFLTLHSFLLAYLLFYLSPLF